MSRYCLVVLQTPLVAQDLAQTLEELTGSISITAQAIEECCLKLAGLGPGSLLYAFIQSDVAGLRDSPLPEMIEQTGGQIVLLGHPAEMEAAREGSETWPVLQQPFGPSQVADLLQRLRPADSSDSTRPDRPGSKPTDSHTG